MALTQQDLDVLECTNPECTHVACELLMIPRCHPRAGLLLIYEKNSGVIRTECKQCKKFVFEFEVSP